MYHTTNNSGRSAYANLCGFQNPHNFFLALMLTTWKTRLKKLKVFFISEDHDFQTVKSLSQYFDNFI